MFLHRNITKRKRGNENMTNYEITIAKGTEIRSKDLNNELSKMIEAVKTLDNSTWDYAKALEKIERLKLYESDFPSRRAFCKAVNVDAAVMAKCITGVVILRDYLIPNGYKEKDFTFNGCYVLSKIGADSLQMFIDSIKANNNEPHIEKMSVRQLADYVNKWIAKKNGAIEGKETEAEAETEKPENSVKALKKGLKIVFNEKEYFIKYEDLVQYEKKSKD